jgi:hypothetical protein
MRKWVGLAMKMEKINKKNALSMGESHYKKRSCRKASWGLAHNYYSS